VISESRVGSKGELFPSKEIREKLGLRPHTKVIYRVEDGKLIIEPVPSLEELITQQPTIEITLKDLEDERRTQSKKAEE